MAKLHPGMKIKTNYSGPYIIQEIQRGCTCRAYRDELNQVPGPQLPHIHLTCTSPTGAGPFYLNRYDEETLQSLSLSYAGNKDQLGHDYIEILENDIPFQMGLF